MKKMVLIGRSEAGKTTLTQALRGEKIHYHKTQYVNNFDVIVDTPGEYAQTKGLGHALALYTYESDIVGLLVSATEPYCLFPPCITCMANREVIGIVTKIHNPGANVKLATSWLQLAGCKKIFYVDSKQQEGIPEILEYLREEGDVMPWEEAEEAEKTTDKETGSQAPKCGKNRKTTENNTGISKKFHIKQHKTTEKP